MKFLSFGLLGLFAALIVLLGCSAQPKIGKAVELVESPKADVMSLPNIKYHFEMNETHTVEGVVQNESYVHRQFALFRVCAYDKDDVLISEVIQPFKNLAPNQPQKKIFSVPNETTRFEVCTAFVQ